MTADSPLAKNWLQESLKSFYAFNHVTLTNNLASKYVEGMLVYCSKSGRTSCCEVSVTPMGAISHHVLVQLAAPRKH